LLNTNNIKKRKLGKDVKLKEYRNFPHGIWSFDIEGGIEECKFVIMDCAKWMNEIIEKDTKKI